MKTARIESVTSPANPLLRDVRRAIDRGGLTSEGLCAAEGCHLLAEAVRSRLEIPIVIFSESAPVDQPPGARAIVIPDKLFQSLASTETSQGVIALVRLPEWRSEQIFGPRSLVVVLDGVQDPGNAGAIVRAAEAFGATGLLFSKGSVNPHNPKALRASAGSFFRVPHVARLATQSVRNLLAEHHLDVWAAVPFTGAERQAEHADFTRPCALIIGSEAHGISKELQESAMLVAIPTAGVESLNAAMAASVLLYEARRQRS